MVHLLIDIVAGIVLTRLIWHYDPPSRSSLRRFMWRLVPVVLLYAGIVQLLIECVR